MVKNYKVAAAKLRQRGEKVRKGQRIGHIQKDNGVLYNEKGQHSTSYVEL